MVEDNFSLRTCLSKIIIKREVTLSSKEVSKSVTKPTLIVQNNMTTKMAPNECKNLIAMFHLFFISSSKVVLLYPHSDFGLSVKTTEALKTGQEEEGLRNRFGRENFQL